MDKGKSSKPQYKNDLLFTAVRKRFFLLALICILLITSGGIYLSTRSMQQSAKNAYQSVSSLISQKIDESLKLLTSLSSLPEFYDPQIPWEEKVAKLDKINEQYGYMFICYMDEDIQVYTLGEEPASLASREHMQKLYATRSNVVTDSFVAGADGVTLNYTVAVPLLMNGEMTGGLFCSIYFDEIIHLLNQAMSSDGVEAVLIGSKGQIMSSTNGLSYGADYMDILRDTTIFQLTTDQLESSLLGRKSGSFTSMNSGNIQHTSFGPIKRTNWDVLVTADFLSALLPIVPEIILMNVAMLLFLVLLYLYTVKQMKKQAEANNSLLMTFHDLEKKLFHSDEVEQIDYENILQMSSKGLKDELTGLSTRTFFLNQANKLLSSDDEDTLITLCFVDLDDLKILNDTYGHSVGDIALKQVGIILREYEKRYDGFSGRYGGDEFILILRDIDDLAELHSILQELVQRFHFSVTWKDQDISIHCSIGACSWDRKASLDTLIANADKALYDVKRHRKGCYSLYLNGEQEYE